MVLSDDRVDLIEAKNERIKVRQRKICAHSHPVLLSDLFSELRSCRTVVERLAEAVVPRQHQRSGRHQNQNSVSKHAHQKLSMTFLVNTTSIAEILARNCRRSTQIAHHRSSVRAP